MTRNFYLRRSKPAPESPDFWFEIIERWRESLAHPDQERHVALVPSEAAGRALVECLNRQWREGVVEGMTRFAWWRDGEQMVGTCGTTLKKAVEDFSRDY